MKKILKSTISFLCAFAMILSSAGINPAVRVYANQEKFPGGVGLSKNVNNEKSKTVYFGKNGENPYAWRVIGFDGTGVASKSGAVTLLASTNLEHIDGFSQTGNDYANSLLKQKVDEITGKLSEVEKAAILGRTLTHGTSATDREDCIAGDADIENVLLWPLSQKEANEVHSELRIADPNHTDWASSYWWLRTPVWEKSDKVYLVKGDGSISERNYFVKKEYGVRPAFYLNMESVLLASAATGGKVSGETGADALTAAVEYEGEEYKLTVLDKSRNFKIRAAKYDEGEKSVKILYKGATKYDEHNAPNEYISAIIKGSDGKLKYYGRVTQPQSEAGEVTLNLKNVNMVAEDKLYAFSEQCNGDKATDYGSAFAEVDLTNANQTPNDYEIKVETDGNGSAGATYQYAASGDEMELTATPNKGYRFKAWEVVSPTSGVTVENNKFRMPNEAVTIKAIFQKIYKVTYHADGAGVTGEVPTDDKEYLEGESVTVKEAGNLAKNGCQFLVWNTSEDGRGADYEPGSKIPAETADIDLYAKWTALTEALPFASKVNTSGAMICFGKENESGSYTWRLIGFDGRGAASRSGAMTLLASRNLAHTNFASENSNVYEDSLLKQKVDEIAGKLSEKEKGVMVRKTLVHGSYNEKETDCVAGEKDIENVFLWPLSIKEAKEVEESLRKADPEHIGWANACWWLRSPGWRLGDVQIVYGDGILSLLGRRVKGNPEYGVRPAFYLDLGTVLFASSTEGGKASGTVGADALSLFVNAGEEYKLTILDESRDFSVSSSEYKAAEQRVEIQYSGANIGENEYISAMLKTEDGKIKYYGRVAKPQSESGSFTVNLKGLDKKDTDKLYVFSEQYHEGKDTDYASLLWEVKASNTPQSNAKHQITVISDGNGVAKADKTMAAKDAEVTLTAEANEGYRFKEWRAVLPKTGINIHENKLTMPDSDVTVKAIFEIKVVELPFTAPGAKMNLFYTGEAQELIDAGSVKSEIGKIEYSLSENGDYSVEIPKAQNVGSYEVYYKVVGDNPKYDYSKAKGKVEVSIAKSLQTEFRIKEVIGKKYGDADFKLSTIGGSGNGAVTYSVPENNGVLSVNGNTAKILGAGTVKVKVVKEGDENYHKTSAELTIEIAKRKPPEIEFPAASELIYGQKLSESKLTGGSTEYGKFTWKDGEIVPNVENSGYEVKFTPKEEIKKNYEIGEKEAKIQVKVKKAKAPEIKFPVAGALTYGQKLSESTLTGGSTKYGKFEWKDGTILPAVENSGYEVIFTPNEEVKKNYEISGKKAKIQVKVKKAAVPEIQFPVASELTYGQKLSESTLTGGSTEYGKFTWKDGEIVPNVENSGYEVVFAPKEELKKNYDISEKEKKIPVKVKKAKAPEIKFPVAGALTYGQKLSESKLTGGSTEYGKFTWKDGEIVPNVENSGYEVVFAPKEEVKKNYEISEKEAKIQVKVKKAKAPEIKFPVAGALTYGQKLSESKLTDGSTEYGTFTWKDGEIVPNVENSGYEVVFTPKEELKKNYEISEKEAKIQVKVKKAAVPEIQFPVASELTYGQKLSESTLTGGSTEYGKFTWKDGEIVPNVENSGYEVVFAPKEELKKNYDISEKEKKIPVKVKKAKAPEIKFPVAGALTYGQKLSESKLTGGSTEYGKFTWKDGEIVPNVENSGYEVVFAPKEEVKKNYEISEKEAKIQVKVKKAKAPEIKFPVAGALTYGQKLSESTLTGGSTEYGKFTWKDGEIVPNVENSGYEVVFTPKEELKKNYEISEKEVKIPVKVKKAKAPEIQFPTAGELTYGQKLSESTLTGGSTEYGTFTWKDGEIVPNVENSGYEVVFAPKEELKKNYEISEKEVKIPVKVKKAVVRFTAPKAKTNLSYTGEKQVLIDTGEVDALIGNFEYSLSESGAYSTEIPTAGDAGVYRVYYKVVGTNANYDYGSAKGEVDVIILALNEYRIIVENDGNGTARADKLGAVKDAEITLTEKANVGYHFKEWQVISGGVTIRENKFIMLDREVKIKAIFEKEATGGASSGAEYLPDEYFSTDDGNASKEEKDVTEEAEKIADSPVMAEISVKAKKGKAKTAKTEVSEKMVEEAVKKAKEEAAKNGKKADEISLEIKVDMPKATDKVKVNLTKNALGKIVTEEIKNFIIISPLEKMVFDKEAVLEMKKQSKGSVTVSIVPKKKLLKKVKKLIGKRPVYDLSVSRLKGKKKMKKFKKGTIKIFIPYRLGKNEKEDGLYIVYVDKKGKAKKVAGSVYDRDSEAMKFTTKNLSVYGVGYKAPQEK